METQTQTDEPVKITNIFMRKNTEPLGETSVPLEDLPSVRLSAKQGEEIHADEYSLRLFYATRICPMTLKEIKRRFPEPSPGKAQSVLNRYIDCELVHRTENGAYYSNYPDNYINYSDHKYDGNIEERKDAKIFETMKEHSGDKKYWETKSYFSIDSFFKPEQTKELQAMFKDIKYKAKQFVQKNAEVGKIDGLKFRRLKFYDMIFSVLFFVLVGTMPVKNVFAGNDPTQPGFSNSIYFDSAKNNAFGNGKQQMVAVNEANTHLFDVATLESMKDYFETRTDETDEPIINTLVEECREFLLPGGNGPNAWSLGCAEMLQEWVMNECVNESQDACNILKSEGLIVEI